MLSSLLAWLILFKILSKPNVLSPLNGPKSKSSSGLVEPLSTIGTFKLT